MKPRSRETELASCLSNQSCPCFLSRRATGRTSEGPQNIFGRKGPVGHIEPVSLYPKYGLYRCMLGQCMGVLAVTVDDYNVGRRPVPTLSP